ncbi:MAG: DUF4062 domain-containing protein [Gammaproteobacteria bacterium]
MISKPQVFISSTSDLETERQALAEGLRPLFEPYLFEQDRARAASPREHCAEMIRASDAFLGVVGSNYGSHYSADDERSICEWEFDTAREQHDLPLMMLLSSVDESSLEPEQRRFRSRLEDFHTGVWCRFFRSSQQLVDIARDSLMQWMIEHLVQRDASSRKRGQWLRRLTAPIAIATVGGLGAAVAANLVLDFLSATQLAGLCGLTLCILALLFMLNGMEGGKHHGH